MGLLKKFFADLSETLVRLCGKKKALNHKVSQSSSQSNSKDKSIKIPLFKQPQGGCKTHEKYYH
jgi:hypothetical protein